MLDKEVIKEKREKRELEKLIDALEKKTQEGWTDEEIQGHLKLFKKNKKKLEKLEKSFSNDELYTKRFDI
jgi:hypothetical protein